MFDLFLSVEFAETSFTRYNRLSNRLNNRLNNRLFNRWAIWQPRLNNRLLRVNKHSTGCQNGWTTSWMFVYTMQPVVQPVVQQVWEPVVSCKRGLRVDWLDWSVVSRTLDVRQASVTTHCLSTLCPVHRTARCWHCWVPSMCRPTTTTTRC